MKKKFLPINIDITNEKILIIGGGQSAYKKGMILERFNANIEFLAMEICDEIRQKGWPYKLKKYNPDDLNGYLMVYSCSNNIELDHQITTDAKARKVLVNIHDKPDLCQYISPAVYQNQNMTVAVSSNGEDVFKSIKLRNYLQNHLDKNMDSILNEKNT